MSVHASTKTAPCLDDNNVSFYTLLLRQTNLELINYLLLLFSFNYAFFGAGGGGAGGRGLGRCCIAPTWCYSV